MDIKPFARVLVVTASAAVAAACQQFSPDNETRTLSFNHSVAESTNQLLLLNIVRDSERNPTYFTRLGTNSANSSISPGLSLTFPFGTLSTGQASGTSSASAQNSLNLENLDDHKYQAGAMRRIDMETVQTFWDEGIQPDALGLLFISTISLPKAEIPVLQYAIKAACTGAKRGQNRYCANVAPDDKCFDEAPSINRDGKAYALYINDPAWEYSDASGRGPAACFQVVLRGLLVLGLHPTSHKSATELDDNVPAKVLRDGTFRAEMIKGGFKVSAKDSGAGYHVTKTASETVFAFDAASVHAFRISDAYRSVLGCKQNQYDDWDVTKKKSKLSPAQRQRVVKARAESVGECAATLFTSDIENDFDDAAVVPVDAMKIDLSVRAFEGVVYYLGEVVRAETTDLKPTHGYDGYYPTIVARTRWGEHSQSNEPLFVVKKGSGSGEVAIAVKDDKGNNYWIPGFCTEFDNRFPVPDNCATEYPNHESLTVLTLLNQLWGLQKEPSVAPTRTITVGGG